MLPVVASGQSSMVSHIVVLRCPYPVVDAMCSFLIIIIFNKLAKPKSCTGISQFSDILNTIENSVTSV